MAPLREDGAARIEIVHSLDQTGAPVVGLSGELDLSNVDKLRRELCAVAAEKPERLVIELADLSFMDSSGIALLVEAAQSVGVLAVRNPSDLIRRVLDATGVSGLLAVEP